MKKKDGFMEPCDVCGSLCYGTGCTCEVCGWGQDPLSLEFPEELTGIGNTIGYRQYKEVWEAKQKETCK